VRSRTLARFLRHSVQAFGVTTPKPLLLLDTPCEVKLGPEVEATDEGERPGAAAGSFPPVPDEVGGADGDRGGMLGAPPGESSSMGSIGGIG
jgi:hypothetical protein